MNNHWFEYFWNIEINIVSIEIAGDDENIKSDTSFQLWIQTFLLLIKWEGTDINIYRRMKVIDASFATKCIECSVSHFFEHFQSNSSAKAIHSTPQAFLCV